MERLVVSWATTEPDRLAARLAGLGFTVLDRHLVDFPAGQIQLIPLESGPGAQRLVDPRWEPAASEPAASEPATSEPALSVAVARSGHPNGVSDIVALGWATVDADRAGAGTPIDSVDAFSSLPDDGQLGARVWGSLARRPATLLLEPATEGRLAATLARVGEGPAALYLAAGGGLAGLVAAGAVRRRADVRPGPLGPAWLLPGGPAWGPHLLVVSKRPTAPR